MILRHFRNLKKYLEKNKVLVIYGPRQSGKTTLLKAFLKDCKMQYRFDSGDNILIHDILSSQNFNRIIEYTAGYELIVLDEAQRITGIGQGLKIIVDQVPNIFIIATGSSSFELAGQIGEPLTGRKRTLILWPISQLELAKINTPFELREQLAERLVLGSYPAVVNATNKNKKIQILEEIVSSYLLKDILELEKIKNAKIILDLLRLLAYQIGSEVSFSELSGKLGIDSKTVSRYIDLMEKSFILYNLRGFSRNLRNEITKKSKYYFWDNGIRNTIISNINPLEERDDIGKLWENFIIIERVKKQSYLDIGSNNYFWQTWDQQEVDLVEERGGKLFGYEIKWKKDKRKPPKSFLSTYSNASYKVINQDNYLDFIT